MRFILLLFIVLLNVGCSYFKPLNSISPVDSEFIQYSGDKRIFFKSGAVQKEAELVSDYLDFAIAQVEGFEGKAFTKPVSVHICDTAACFDHYTGYGKLIKAGVGSNGLFLSPRVFDGSGYKLFLTHELTHLHLFQQISLYDAYFIPQWFHEGVAVYFSRGGGAEGITKSRAIQYLKDGKQMIPTTDTILFTSRWPINYKASDDFKFQQQMNYRQSALFVAYLDEQNPVLLKKLIRLLEQGKKFRASFEKVYGASVNEKWRLFLQFLKR